MLPALTRLDVALEAVTQRVQQVGDHRVANVMPQPFQGHCQRPRALARPAQWRLGIARRRRFHQRVQISQESAVGLGRAFPPTARPATTGQRQRLARVEIAQAALDRRLSDPGGSRHRSNAAVADRACFRRGPYPARTLRQHRHECGVLRA